MLRRTLPSVLAWAFMLLAVPAPDLTAQEGGYPPPEAHLGVSLIAGDPVGEFGQFVGAGLGADFFGRLPLDARGILSFRGDLGFLIYGYESNRVCFDGVGCRVQADLITSNNIVFGGVGPELSLPLPGFRPYLHAFWGFSYFTTVSSLEDGWDDYESSFETENYGDGTVSWGFGGGVEAKLSQGRVPVALNLGFRYHRNGRVSYLTKGDIVDNPDGSITLYPVSSDGNLVSYHIGVSFGIPRGGNRH